VDHTHNEVDQRFSERSLKSRAVSRAPVLEEPEDFKIG